MSDPNPFLGAAFAKAFRGFAVPGLNMDAAMASHRKNIEALAQANQVVIDAVQTFATRQAEIAHGAIQEAPGLMRDMGQPSAANERLAKNAAIAKDTLERNVAVAKELGDLIAKANDEAFGLIVKRFSEALDELRQAAEKS